MDMEMVDRCACNCALIDPHVEAIWSQCCRGSTNGTLGCRHDCPRLIGSGVDKLLDVAAWSNEHVPTRVWEAIEDSECSCTALNDMEVGDVVAGHTEEAAARLSAGVADVFHSPRGPELFDADDLGERGQSGELVEKGGIEPPTSCMPCKRSSN